MKQTLLLFVLLSRVLAAATCQATPPQNQHPAPAGRTPPAQIRENRGWKAATYRGLVMGKSTRADMLRTLGKPESSEPPEGELERDKSNPEIWYYYEGVGEFEGQVVVAVDKLTGLVNSVEIRPVNLSKGNAIRHFGEGYVITKYSFDDCLGNEEAAPLYESPDGPVTNVEYRERGISISIGHQDQVNHIIYVSKPVGASESKCATMKRPS